MVTRIVGLVALLLLALPAWLSNAEAQTKVVRADWRIQGPQVPFIIACVGASRRRSTSRSIANPARRR
jgi:hypothetical protein